MDFKTFQALRKVSLEAHKEACFGSVRSLNNKEITSTLSPKVRFRFDNFADTGELYLTSDNILYNLMGFMSAITYLNRKGYLNLEYEPTELFGDETENEKAYILKLDKENQNFLSAINKLIIDIELGDD